MFFIRKIKKLSRQIRKNKKFIYGSNKKNAFVILIAIVVSSFLVSLGMFIANIAYKELLLSISLKDSQRAFFVADTVMECALSFDNTTDGFKKTIGDSQSSNNFALPCNGANFDFETYDSFGGTENYTSVYFVSFANDANDDQKISQAEMEADNAPYAKLIVSKETLNGIKGGKTNIKVYGHNRYTGKNIVERALEVNY